MRLFGIVLQFIIRKANKYFNIVFEKYDDLNASVQENMKYWLEAIMPICDEYDINMCVHPDDPPYPVFGSLIAPTSSALSARYFRIVGFALSSVPFGR